MTSEPNHSHDELFAADPDNQRRGQDQTTEPEAAEAAQMDQLADSRADVDSKLAELEVDLAAANDRVVRAQAELENFRKRVYREMEEERKYASLPLLRGLLPVMDNLDRAIESTEKNHDFQGMREGVRLVAQQFRSVLQQHHCTMIEAKGKLFDPHLHEAIAQLPSQDVPAGTVIDATLPGYVLHDRVVRASQVLVSSGAQAIAESSGE
jgi:molecular chaperone GrpE